MKPFIAFTRDEVQSLLLQTVKHGDLRCHVLFLICLQHGLRVSEALGLTRANFSEQGGRLYLTVARLKGSRTTVQEVASHSNPLLDEKWIVGLYLDNLKRDRLFELSRSGADYLIKMYGRWAGIHENKTSMHKLKHSLGTFMRKNGADVVQIQHALGHADIRSTLAYLRPSADEVEEARLSAFTVTQYTRAAAGGGR